MKNQETILSGMFAQVYTRLVTAACLQAHLYYSDLSPVVFGVQLTRLRTNQIDAIWELLFATMKLDIKHGRPPVAALYVSRVNDERKPGRQFFAEYKRLTGKTLTDDDWQEIVASVWEHYAPPIGSKE